jgi:parallel beta-helix repeat protein
VTNRSQRRHVAPVAGLLLALVALLLPFAGSASAAGPAFFVDGKHGNDANNGTSLGSAFKTIKAGLWALRYGGTLDVVGYTDYVYYETMTASQWFINGTSSTPVVIRAYGYGTSGYVRPIVSGAKAVSRPRDGKWTRPDATHYPDVWQTSWTTAIPGYESSVNAYRQERVFADVSQPLVRPASFSLANLQATPGSQWWNGSKLYVRLGGWGSTPGASLDPNDHTIEIPFYTGLLVSSGSNYVQIMGFNVRHTTMGVGFTGTASHDLVQDVDASYNYTMGFFTASSYNTFRRITGSRNTIQLIKLDNGADHNVVEYAMGTENMGQGVKLTGSGTQYNTVRWSTFRGGKDVPTNQGGYGGYVQGIDIEQGANNNTIDGNTIQRNRRGLMLYQINSSGGTLAGNTIKYNVFVGNDDGVVLWDGKYTTAQGKGAVSFYRNVYDSNTKAVTSESYTSGKSFVHETYYKTGTVKTQSHSTFYLKAGSISVKDSIVYSSAGYNFYAASGAKLSVSYTTFIGTGIAFRNSATTVPFGSGVVHLNPGFLSLDPASADYLYIGRGSAGYTVSSSRGPVGARWR